VDIATIAWNRSLVEHEEKNAAYSLYLSEILEKQKEKIVSKFAPDFPGGIPNIDNGSYFLLEDGIDFIPPFLSDSASPYFGYFHFYPPHDPYLTRKDFHNTFLDDGFLPKQKEQHLFGKQRFTTKIVNEMRRTYDELVLYVDAEFARLYNMLEESGMLDNTWVFLTSDHGESFERGLVGHTEAHLFQPSIRVPLVVFPPGKTSRTDVYQTTSATDILPTISAITGHEIPDWTEGQILPEIGAQSDNGQDVFALHVQGLEKGTENINHGRGVLIRDDWKLIYTMHDPELDLQPDPLIELFNLKEDPDELLNLYATNQTKANELISTLLKKIEIFSQEPYYE
jgi:arylsulfatase A-like enzyme